MTLSDLPPTTDVTSLKVKLPARALRAFRAYGGGEAVMYPVGHCMGYGFMMSPQPPGDSKRTLYPLPPSVSGKDLLKWRVVK